FFFQADDGIRDGHVTGVQTCALPIWKREPAWSARRRAGGGRARRFAFPCQSAVRLRGRRFRRRRPACIRPSRSRARARGLPFRKIGRASCRERVYLVAAAEAREKTRY